NRAARHPHTRSPSRPGAGNYERWASPTCRRGRAIMPRTSTPSRPLKKLPRPAGGDRGGRGSRPPDRDLVPDAMRMDAVKTDGRPTSCKGAPMSSTTTDHDDVIHLAIELSGSTWLFPARMPGARRASLHRIDGGDATALLALVTSLRSKLAAKLKSEVAVACCFEAGRDGFWLHRLLTAHGIASHVLEPTSILVNRPAGPP